MEEKIYITKEKLQELEEQLSNLLNVERPLVIEELQAARAQGDLSENADYDAAREKHAKIENLIKDIGYKIDHHVIIEGEKGSLDQVSLGATVTVFDYDDNAEKIYVIVGTEDSDPALDRISNLSPLAKKMEGKKVGDKITIDTNDYSYKIEILKIERKSL